MIGDKRKDATVIDEGQMLVSKKSFTISEVWFF
jgi:hypothetical protein